MAKTIKSLSIAQLLVLSTAAQRHDRMVMPLPSGLRARGASQRILLTSLLTLLLVEEVATIVVTQSWRKDADGQHYALQLTRTGLNAVGTDPRSLVAEEPAAGAPESAEAESAELPCEPQAKLATATVNTSGGSTAPVGKLGGILEAVSAPNGATIGELIILTGWLPHTTRAALTRLRQRGYPLTLSKSADRKAYHLAPSQDQGA